MTMNFPLRCLAILAIVSAPAFAQADDDAFTPAGPIAVSPPLLELKHPRQPHSLALLGMTADGYTLQTMPRFASAHPQIATVDDRGWVHPVANGQTRITIAVAGQMLTVPVNVQLPAAAPQSSFRHEVMAVLSKAGCNAGACHGYSLGKNGFKLSLRGSDPDQDFEAISREMYGRRVNLGTPADSLLVAKAANRAPHEGGRRILSGSPLEGMLISWVRDGAPGDIADTNHVVAVKMLPEKLVLRRGQKHPLQFIAHYSDGSTRDVTRLGIFSANNTQFADVDEEGLVTAGDAGETVIVARFERTFAATGVVVLDAHPDFNPTPVPQGHLIDQHVVEKLNRLKIVPSPRAGDEEFLRRVSIDLIGVRPKPEEIRAFLADSDPQKHEKLIDALLERPEFVDHWSLKWGDLLQNSRNSVSSSSVYLFREFIRGAIAENMPLDEFARRIFTAKGGVVDDPASVYFAISKDTNDTVERATQVFCGVRMLCARCHTHPMENWTQADYYGLASFFSQVSTRADARYPNVQGAKLVQVNLTAGGATHPRTGKPQPPRFLGGTEPSIAANLDRRQAYAGWLTSPENPFFARGLVNRIWSYYFHRGIIEPVDDVRNTNPPINPALLDALTKDFIEHKFDMRHLMRRIVTSETYQRSAAPTPSNRRDEQNFSRFIPRRVPAEALLDCLVQATGVAENFGGAPAGIRAAQLPDANVSSPFLGLFGKPQRMDACECERDNNSNMLQALHFINGNTILGRVQNGNGRVAQLLKEKKDDAELVTELYLWSLARNPTADEVKVGVDHIKSYGEARGEAVQDLVWALLNSKDFLLVH